MEPTCIPGEELSHNKELVYHGGVIPFLKKLNLYKRVVFPFGVMG